MNRKVQIVGALILTLLLTVGLVPAGAVTGAAVRVPEAGPVGLVHVRWQADDDLALLEEMDIPAYARLEDARGPYLLAGASAVEVATLADRGLAVQILDTDVTGAAYYLASTAPGLRAPEWGEYGQVLFHDSERALIRLLLGRERGAVEALAQAGASLQAVTLDPKPLYPRATASNFPQAVVPDPIIASMLAQVESATVSQLDRELAGDLPVWVDGDWYTIATRYTYSGTPIQKAGHYVGQRMADLGLDVEYHVWDAATNPNVIAELPGLVNPDDIYIIGGHLDSITYDNPMVLAPGADDNASGSVAAILAAEILSQYDWGCTLRFAFWTGEEQGLLGSHVYAQRAYNAGENILGYLNLDMIAWNTIGSTPDIDLLYNQSMPATLQLAQLFDDVVDAYNLNLVPELSTSLSGGSDHSSFWQYGYTAILGIEDQGDFNPYYHSNGDTPAHTDVPYFTEFVKASLGTFAHMTGCLIPDGIGALDGHVTAAGSGTPLPDVTITMVGQGGANIQTTTDSSGYYTQTLLADTYTVTAEAYAYLPAVITDVVVMTGTVTTQDIVLEAAPTYVVSGTVTEAGSGTPLLAEIAFDGSPVTATTDPTTGFYAVSLPGGAYTMHVRADGHRAQERPIVVDGDQTQSFELEPLPCILLVDDDNNAPDVRPYYQAALDALGYDYDVFVASGGSGPSAAEMEGYKIVIWFSGDAYSSTSPAAGPNANDEVALAAYLDGGGSLFLSSQDYLYDMGLTTFGQDYLGIASRSNDSGNASAKYGVAGDPIGGGLGPYSLLYPTNFSDFGDIVNAGAGASVAFRSAATDGNNLDVDKDGGAWKTVFFGTSWVPIQNASPANGQAVMQRIVDWFGGCACEPPVNLDFSWTPPLPAAGVPVTFSATAEGDLPMGYTWDLGDGTGATGAVVSHVYAAPGDYSVAVTATNSCGIAVITYTVSVSGWCEPAVCLDLTWAPAEPFVGETVVFTGTAAGDLPIEMAWDLGEGEVVTGTTVSYAYPEPGEYTVLMSVVNACGSDWMTGTIEVTPCEPVSGAALAWEPPLPTPGETVTFTATATGTQPIAYTWSLGDGQTASGATVTHTYTGAGEYPIVMTATNVCGTDIVSDVLLVVEPACEGVSGAALAWAPPVPAPGEAVTFTGTASGTQPITYTWAFGDGQVAGGITATHTYSQAGQYPIVMTATNACGSDVAGSILAVTDLPCEPVELVTVTVDTANCTAVLGAELAGSPPFTYTWDLGEWGMLHTPAGTVTVSASGTYPYTLTVTNCGGAFASVRHGTFTVDCQAPRWYTYVPLVVRGH